MCANQSTDARVSISAKRPVRKRRRWLRVLLVLILLCVVLAYVSPYVLSTGWGTSLAQRIADGQVRGRIELGALSLTWLGPCEVRDLRVLDADGREVLAVPSVRYDRGLWHAIWAWEDFEQVEIASPSAALYVDEQGRVSLSQALEPTRPRRPRRERPLPDPTGKLLLDGGSLRIAGPAGQTHEITDIRLSCSLSTLDHIEATFGCSMPGGKPLRGEVALFGLTRQGRPSLASASGHVTLTGSELDIAPLAALIGANELAGQAAIDLNANLDDAGLDGHCDMKLQGLALRVGRVQLTGEISGNWRGAVADAGKLSKLAGTFEVRDLDMLAGEVGLRQDSVRIVHDISLDTKAGNMDISAFALRAAPPLLSLEMAGRVSGLRGSPSLDLAGRYDGSWERMGPLLEALAPQLRSVFAPAGQTGGEFHIAGPLHQPDAKPPYRGLDAAVAVGWGSAKAYDLDLGQARLAPRMSDARVVLPTAEIAAAGGTLRLAGEVDLRGEQPVFSLPGSLTLLQDVEISRQFSHEVLSRVNPLFAGLADIDGKVSLVVEGLRLPLGEDLKTAGEGRGRLDLKQMTIRPAGFLASLLTIAGLPSGEPLPAAAEGVDFQIVAGGIAYENFTILFGKNFDLRFRGRVNFDDTLNLIVSIPVRSALLKRLGVTGPAAEYARLLEGARVEIPISGTRLRPRLDTSEVDIRPLLDRAMKALLAEQAMGRLEDLTRRGEEPPPTTQPAEEKPTTAPAGKAEPTVDGLLRILEGAIEQRQRRQ